MTLQSSSNSVERVASRSTSFSSTSTDSSVELELPLSHNGNRTTKKPNLSELVQNITAQPGTSQNKIQGGAHNRIGHDYHIQIQKANITIPSPDPNSENQDISDRLNFSIQNGLRPPPPEAPITKPGLIRRHFKAIIIVITTFTLLCVVILVSFHFFGNDNSDQNFVPTTTTTKTTMEPSTSEPNLVHYVLNRSSWGAREPARPLTPIETAPKLVIIKHTKTAGCFDVSNCLAAMKNLQNDDISANYPDIRYNFVVGGDGNIYEGRGWNYENEQMNQTIDIAFLGDFNSEIPSEFMVRAGPWMVVKGLFNGFLTLSGFRIVCHNQTELTDSPGVNLYKEVVKWTYYSNETFID